MEVIEKPLHVHYQDIVLIYQLNSEQCSCHIIYSKLELIETRALDMFITTMAVPT